MFNALRRTPFLFLLLPLVCFILWGKVTEQSWVVGSTAMPLDTVDSTYHLYRAALTSTPIERPKTWRYDASLIDLNDYAVPLYIHKSSVDSLPHLGDTLLVYAQPRARMFAHHWTLYGANQTPWWRTPRGWQQRLEQRYAELGISGQELGTLSALTLGYREDLDQDIRRAFSAAGAMHVLAVSGLHTGILMTVLIMIVTLCGRIKPLYHETGKQVAQGLIVIAMLAFYAYITGGSPSIIRSVIMASLFVLASMVHRPSSILNIIFAAAFIILVIHPADLFSISFQLSFAAVIAIVLFGEGWSAIMPTIHFARPFRWCYPIYYYVYALIGMSLAAQIGTMPITLHYFGQMSNYFLLTNLIVIPLAWCMMVGGVATLTIGWWTPIGKLLAWALNGITWLMNISVQWLESLPGSTTQITISQLSISNNQLSIINNLTSYLLPLTSLLLLLAWKYLTTPRLKWK